MFRKCWQALCCAMALSGCVVDPLPMEGRSCDEQHGCASPMVCDPATRACRRGADFTIPDLAADGIDFDLQRPPDVDAAIDQAIDASPPKKMTCEVPAFVGSVGDAVKLSTPALRIDGLTLVTKASVAKGAMITMRPAADQSFGAWEPFELPPQKSDPYYFEWGGQEQLIMTSSGETPRKLWLCSAADPAVACTTIDVLDEAGTKVKHDMDGPSVVQVGATLLMAFNIQPLDVADVYLAQPKDAANLSVWVAMPAGASNDPILHEDDPALSPDGKVLVFERRNVADTDWDLWVAYRNDMTAGFSVAEPLASVNSSASDGSPSLYGYIDGKLELFFSSDRLAPEVGKIYRSTCSLE